MRILVFFLLVAGACVAQVQSTPDAGAGSAAPAPSTPMLAPGSLAIVNYTPTAPPSTLAATVSLLPASAAAPTPAQVISVIPYAITFVVPDSVPPGDAQLVYKVSNSNTQWTRVSIVPANLSLFRRGPTGPLVAQNINPDGTQELNGLTAPAQPSQAVVLWGTGLGATPGSAVGITLGGVAQTVLYAGAAPGQPGLNQINFRVAPGTPDGCYVPLTVTYGTRSLTSFLSKTSDGQPCHHPFDLSFEAMKLLDNGIGITTGEVTLSTAIQAPASDRASRQETAQVLFPQRNASDIAANFSAPAGSAVQPCAISPGTLSLLGAIISNGDVGSVTLGNATSSLTLPWTSPPSGDAALKDLAPPVFAAGDWTWKGSGGPLLAASSFDFHLPPPLQIAGGAPLVFDRSQDQTITWDGSGFDSAAVVHVSVTAQYIGAPVLTCFVPASGGSVTLSSNLLGQFNAGAAGVLSASVTETGPGIPHALFKTPSGAPLLMLVRWSSADSRPVDFK